MKENLSEEDKMTIWIHYMVKQCYLNAWLKIEQNSSLSEFRIRSYDDFCSEKDDRMSEGLLGYYWRFYKDISLFL